jgi:hypothetical protein
MPRKPKATWAQLDDRNRQEPDSVEIFMAAMRKLFEEGINDNGPAWTPTRTYTAISTATTTDITVAPTSGQKIVLDDCLISCDAACAVSIVEETSGTVLAKVFVPAPGTVQITLRDAIKAAVADKKLRAITSEAVNTSITACYHSEA